MVVYNTRGTAYYVLANLPYKVAGKTGTATTPTGGGNSHAWFAGITEENRENQPDIAIAIILENAGEGSEMAAPLFRRIVQLYFSDNKNPGRSMPWEASPYVIASPTPLVTDTLEPVNNYIMAIDAGAGAEVAIWIFPGARRGQMWSSALCEEN